ncbi:MAG: PKD domain-containing protein [Verrucomicrobiota bacterium]
MVLTAFCGGNALTAATLYVNVSGTNPNPPFAAWATAATNIQDAVDMATPGDLVLVTNGVYQEGGRIVYGALMNRVAATSAITVQSVNGAGVTRITGSAYRGDSAIRCVYLTNGASLVGFTLESGATRNAGDEFAEQCGGGVWCESSSAVLSNCVITGCTANCGGGGAYQGTLYSCVVSNNSSGPGDETFGLGHGGGGYSNVLNNCSISANLSYYGGGAFGCVLNNCTVTSNTAEEGGGADNSTIHNSILIGNTQNNQWNSSLDYCCIQPLVEGAGNIDSDPQLTDGSRISAASPCRGAGSALYSAGTDIDGEPWLNPPSIGCDEYYVPWGPLTVAISAGATNAISAFNLSFSGLIVGGYTGLIWNLGDGTTISNQLNISHTWMAPGDYTLYLTVYNSTYFDGVSNSVTVHIRDHPVQYVSPASLNPSPPYTTWQNAAHAIQDALDSGFAGGTVLVSNGVYSTGGRTVYGSLTNRVAATQPMTIRSVNGPAVTIIQGNPGGGETAVRCVYLTNGASLSGFTLTGGSTRNDGDSYLEQSGAAVWCESTNGYVSNCVISASSAAYSGGAAYEGTLYSCTLSNNSAFNYGGGAMNSVLNVCWLYSNASYSGGGAAGCLLNNCTLVSNAAQYGGGTDGGTMNNCIIAANTAPNGPNYYGGTLNYCCTQPLPSTGSGNIANDPHLSDSVHLTGASPCRNAGIFSVLGMLDLDAQPFLNPPSIGCDEYYASDMNGPLLPTIIVDITNALTAYTFTFTGSISGRYTQFVWNFGDGTSMTNQLVVTHTWPLQGDFPVVLTAYNETYPGGIASTVTVHTLDHPVQYVSSNGINPVPPYLSWATAATNIQDAINAGYYGGTILVSNGIYSAGGRVTTGALTNRVAISIPMTVTSINGPNFTVIKGFQIPGIVFDGSAVRCAYLTNGASLIGFTLTGGGTAPYEFTAGNDQSGGGIWCESAGATISNCVIVGNSASYSGGGSYQGTFYNCVFSNNAAAIYGGGCETGTVVGSLLYANSAGYRGGAGDNCTFRNSNLIGNSAVAGGGAYRGSAMNSIFFLNRALYSADSLSTGLGYCWTSDPNLADLCHLSPSSPCIDGGLAFYVQGTDIDGEAWNSPPSIGCDEFWTASGSGSMQVVIQCDGTNAVAGLSTVNLAGLVTGHATSNRWNFGDGASATNLPLVSHSFSSPGNYAVSFSAYNASNPGGISATVMVHVIPVHTYPGLVHYVDANGTNPVSPFLSWGTAATNLQLAIDAADVGDRILATNGIYSTGGYMVFQTNSPPDSGSGQMTRAYSPRPVLIQSVNGPAVTLIRGAQPNLTGTDFEPITRCVYLTNGAMLDGFTLTNGTTADLFYLRDSWFGGGVLCAGSDSVVSNCVIAGNTSVFGGGISGGTLYNCSLLSNSAAYTGPNSFGLDPSGGGTFGSIAVNCTYRNNLAAPTTGQYKNPSFGGGACFGVLSNCVLINNSAYTGGGAASNTLVNCTLLGNAALYSVGGASQCTLSNCSVVFNTSTNSISTSTGGVGGGKVWNSIIASNSASLGSGGVGGATVYHSSIIGNVVTRAVPGAKGGGASICALTDCIITDNSAYSGGGVASPATLTNCLVARNTAVPTAGGVLGGTVVNCTVVSNTATDPSSTGGGIASATVYNSILIGNSAASGPNYSGSTLKYCLTLPATSDATVLTNDPAFVDPLNGNYHLQSNSPCINSGFNSYIRTNIDLDGNPRIQGGTVDIGAYEFQSPSSILSYAWAQQYGIPTGGSADFTDPDHDGMNNWQEWQTHTDPINAASALKMLSFSNDVSGMTIAWQGVSGVNYFIERSSNLGAHPGFFTLATNIAGQDGTNTFIDTSAAGSRLFYRVGVQTPGYQVQSAASTIPFTWLQKFDLPTDGSADFTDPDHDGLNDWQEWKAGTSPLDAGSVLKMISATNDVSGITVTWQSVPGIYYNLLRSSDPAAGFSTIAYTILGQPGNTSYTDGTATGPSPYFYRVQVP